MDEVCESTSPKYGLGGTGKDLEFGSDGTPETRCHGIPSRRGVNLSNHVWIPQAQYAVYSKTSTEFYVCHEDHVQTQLGWTRNKS